MNYLHCKICFALLLSLFFGCNRPQQTSESKSANQANSNTEERAKTSFEEKPKLDPVLCDECEEALENIYVKSNTLSYGGYDLEKREKTITIDRVTTDLLFAVIKKAGAVLTRFDKVNSTLGNDTRFGLFHFLGGENQQFIVEQLSNRWWEYWIISPAPKFHVIYESSKYPVSYGMGILDLDNDGVFEIVQELETFWFFDGLCGACSPRIPMVFKYDKAAGQYFPASHIFQDFTLNKIEGQIAKVQKLNETTDFEKLGYTGDYLAAVLLVMVNYIYAGKEKEAWEFYDKEYRLQNKEELRRKVRSQLNHCAVYRYIYRR